jgi:hypothetical protein
MRAAALFARLASEGEPVARDGSRKIVEVYPAAALCIWGFNAHGYKRKKNTDARCRLLQGFIESTAGWLTLGTDALRSCQVSDDALDALIAAVVARAHAVNRCQPLASEFTHAALTEGWIALPMANSLSLLV